LKAKKTQRQVRRDVKEVETVSHLWWREGGGECEWLTFVAAKTSIEQIPVGPDLRKGVSDHLLGKFLCLHHPHLVPLTSFEANCLVDDLTLRPTLDQWRN